MSRRKSEITGHMNERDFPHLVELELPPGGFRNKSQEFESFHREPGRMHASTSPPGQSQAVVK